MFLQGILRNSSRNISCSDSTDETCHTTDNTNTSNDDNKICSISNSPKTSKHVTFDDKISKKKYKPNKSVLSALKLSSHQEKKLEKLRHKDSFSLSTRTLTRINPTNSLEFQQIDYSDSSENDSSDSDT